LAFALYPPVVSVPLQDLPVAAAALDGDGIVVAVNQRFVRLCGDEAAAALGQRLADVLAARDRPALEEVLQSLATLEAYRGSQKRSIRALRARPPSLWLSIDVARLGTGSVVPYLACLQALSKRRRSDKLPNPQFPSRCEQSESSGSNSIAFLTSQDGEQRPPSLMMLSHELRGPLMATRGWARMAETGVLSPEKVPRAFTVIERHAASLSGAIENLSDLSRRSTGSLELTRQVLDLNPLVQLVVESTLPAARQQHVNLTVTCEGGPLHVDGDRSRLEQIVRNLLDNAIRFTPAAGHVHVHTGREGPFATVAVSDTGPGVPPDLLPVIVEPFRRADGTVQRSERGLGLGLALVRELVRLHDGDVDVLSGEKGLGSTVIVKLPLAGTAARRVISRSTALSG
jgi:nitrogen fixation/metabolism regulation signal transduction histidine kinase